MSAAKKQPKPIVAKCSLDDWGVPIISDLPGFSDGDPVVVVPMSSAKAARARRKFEAMPWPKKAKVIAKALAWHVAPLRAWADWHYTRQDDFIIQAECALLAAGYRKEI